MVCVYSWWFRFTTNKMAVLDLFMYRVKLKLKKLKLAAFLNKLMKIVKSDTDINNACKA